MTHTDHAAPELDRWICGYLESHGIPYRRYEHAPVFTCEETTTHVPAAADALQTKNLFLRDKRGRRHWLVVTLCEKTVDIAALGEALDAGRLSFGSPERLLRYLGVTPGSVTLLALAHEGARAVEVIIDADAWTGDPLRCHPMVNTATLVLERADVERFLAATSHAPTVLRVPAQR